MPSLSGQGCSYPALSLLALATFTGLSPRKGVSAAGERALAINPVSLRGKRAGDGRAGSGSSCELCGNRAAAHCHSRALSSFILRKGSRGALPRPFPSSHLGRGSPAPFILVPFVSFSSGTVCQVFTSDSGLRLSVTHKMQGHTSQDPHLASLRFFFPHPLLFEAGFCIAKVTSNSE